MSVAGRGGKTNHCELQELEESVTIIVDDFPQDLETQNFLQTIKRGARSECELRDLCSDGSAARDKRSMPMSLLD